MRYLISYDLRKPGKDYQNLWDALHAINAVRILQSAWLVRRTNTTPLQLAKYCFQHMDSNDGIFVNEVPDNYAHANLLADPASV